MNPFVIFVLVLVSACSVTPPDRFKPIDFENRDGFQERIARGFTA